MFKNPFSFDGRIRRLEYGISHIIFGVLSLAGNALTAYDMLYGAKEVYFIVIPTGIVMLWFILAQGAKRSHDIGQSGWWQLVPLYGIYLLFATGQSFRNRYGENPKTNFNPQQNYLPDQNEFNSSATEKSEPIPIDKITVNNEHPETAHNTTIDWIPVIGFAILMFIMASGLYLANKKYFGFNRNYSDYEEYVVDSLETVIEEPTNYQTPSSSTIMPLMPHNSDFSERSTNSLSLLKNSNGKYPSDIDLWENGTLKKRMIELMGYEFFEYIKIVCVVEIPIVVNDDYFIAKGCQAHNCSMTNYVIIYQISKDLLTIGVRLEDEIDYFTEANELPNHYWSWRERK